MDERSTGHSNEDCAGDYILFIFLKNHLWLNRLVPSYQCCATQWGSPIPNETHFRALSKVKHRLLPFMVLMYCVNFLDRVNVSFAALQMNHDLGFTPKTYGLAAGILFVGYVAFEIPSNMILARVGANRWLSRIMITWGMLGIANAFIHTSHAFFAVRFLLGLAEAGFFPGLIYYMMRWFPARERAAAIALFMLGNPISVVLGAPLSTALLNLPAYLGMHGWQWLFILEGIPAIVLGVLTPWWLTESPEQAKWLTPEEQTWLTKRIASEAANWPRKPYCKLRAIFCDLTLLALAFSKFCVLLAFFGVTMWLPQIIKSMGQLTNFQTRLISAIPYATSAILSVLVSRHSDRTGERRLHIAVPALIGCIGFVMAALVHNPYLGLVGICIAASGLWISNTIFWTLPVNLLAGTAAAAGIAMINTIGNFGGFVGPYLTGWLRETTKGYTASLLALSGFLALSAVIVVTVGRQATHDSMVEANPLAHV